MIYIVVLFLLLFLSIRYDINGKTKYRDQWYNAVLFILIMIAGLRFRLGEDTINYMYEFYYETPYLGNFDIDFLLNSGEPPLWILLNSIVKTLCGRFFVVQLIQAMILNTLILKYFKKHSSYPFACVLLFFFWRYQWYSMVIMKAAIALAIILFANDYFLDKKHIKGLLLIFVATGFHQSSILLVVLPFLTFLRFNKFGVLLLACTYLLGFFLQSMLGEVFEMLEFADGMSNKLDSYLDSSFMTQDHNIKFFILTVFPIVIYPLISLFYLKKCCKDSPVLRLEPFLMIGLLFQMMQFSIHIFYRYVYIYSVYYIIFLVHFFIEFSMNSLKLKKPVALIRTFSFFLPLFISFVYLYSLKQVDFNPYSSVIEKSIDKKREHFYAGFVRHYYLKMNDY